MNGIIILDKPYGWSSNYAVQQVKRLTQTKIGHAGTLDPAATGMLLLFLGKTTKFVQYLLDADKSYLVTGKLGFTTASGDRETEEIAGGPWQNLSYDLFKKTIDTFLGKQLQIPPMYSALKQQGIPLYRLARQGKNVQRPAREITINQLEILTFNPPFFELSVRCSKGTYIRTLIEDIGNKLNCGAYVYRLRRTAIAALTENQMVDFKTLETTDVTHHLLPLETVFAEQESINLNDQTYLHLKTGFQTNFCSTDGYKKLYYLNQFIGLGMVKAKQLKLVQHFNND